MTSRDWETIMRNILTRAGAAALLLSPALAG